MANFGQSKRFYTHQSLLLFCIAVLICLSICHVFLVLKPMLDVDHAEKLSQKLFSNPPSSNNYVSCPGIKISSKGEWKSKKAEGGKKVWDWVDPARKMYETSSRPTRSAQQISMATLLKRHNASLVFYGSSHMRELYASVIRLEQGLPYNAVLPENITHLPSGSRYKSKECDPARRGWISGLLGVDLEKCGLPGRRMVPELGRRVAIGFKTFLHTPDADAQFLDFLTENNLRSPSFLVVDVGIWGVRGDKMGGSSTFTMAPEKELEYYLDWIQSSFPRSKIVFVYEPLDLFPSLQAQLLSAIQKEVDSGRHSVFVLRKDYLLRNRPRKMPCGHGCAGPVMETLAAIFLEWLNEILSGHSPCSSTK